MKLMGSLAIVLVGLGGCTSNKHVPKEINPQIDSKGTSTDGVVGLNEKGEAIIQQDRQASDELRVQQMVNEGLLARLRGDHHSLKRCREDMADPRLGGSGEIDPIPEVDNMRSATEIREEIGITPDGDLRVVRREYFADRLASERSYEQTLGEMIRVVSDNKNDCERRMAIARRRVGLPSERFQAEGYMTNNGVFVQTRPQERSLDDAFAIQRDLQAKQTD